MNIIIYKLHQVYYSRDNKSNYFRIFYFMGQKQFDKWNIKKKE